MCNRWQATAANKSIGLAEGPMGKWPDCNKWPDERWKWSSVF